MLSGKNWKQDERRVPNKSRSHDLPIGGRDVLKLFVPPSWSHVGHMLRVFGGHRSVLTNTTDNVPMND